MNDFETAVLAEADLTEPWGLVESFATFKREHPRDVDRGMEEVAERLRRHGVPVQMHVPRLYLSLPGAARVEANGASYRAKPPAFSVNTPAGLTAKLVYIGANHADNIDTIFDRRLADPSDLRARIEGNIVISEGFASPGMIDQFESLGAVGVIGINAGVDIHWGICTSIWGTPDLDDLPRKPSIPSVAVNRPDGDALIAVAESGGEVTLYAETEEGWFDSKLPEVFIEGAMEPEKYVLVHGHLDSWDVGVGDNATGDATLLELARILWKHRAGLRRSVRIAWWPGHSTGRYGGSTWFADTFAIDLEENCVAQVNCDSPGCRWATEFINLSRMTETDRFISEVIREVTGKEAGGERPHRAGDYSFNNIGISGYFMLSSTMPPELREEKGYYAVGGCGGNIAWHTENDTLEIADRDNLLRDIKVYALAIARNANAEILPFDWRATASEFIATIDDYQGQAGERFDFGPARRATEALSGALDQFHAGIEAGRVSADSANRVIQELARILVPANFAREPRFRHDPALTVPPLPTLSAAGDLDSHDESTVGFATTQLLRGQNRLVSALNQARRLVESAG